MVKNFSNQEAFTLIELMIVISVIGILLAMVIPNGTKVQEQAEIKVIKQQLKTLRSFNELLKQEYKKYPSYVNGSYTIPDALKEYVPLEDRNYKYLAKGSNDLNNNDGEFTELGSKADTFNGSQYLIWYDLKIAGKYYYIDSYSYQVKSSVNRPELFE